MANSKREKVNKNPDKIRADVVVIIIVMIIIAAYIFIECYNATHTEVETITAVTSTVYDTIDARALVIRDEQIIENKSSGVTVACADDGEKIKVNGNIAMLFSSEENAKNYQTLQSLHGELDYYVSLEGKPDSIASNIETVDKDIMSNVNAYIRASGLNNVDTLDKYTEAINDRLTRRQMIIGENIDLSQSKADLQTRINAINANSCAPTGYLTSDKSGIFSSYTDGLENSFDYDNIEKLDVQTLNSYIQTAENAQNSTQSFGKLISAYEWYFCCVVSTDDVKDICNGDVLEVAVKDSDETYKCQVLCGADAELGKTETVLILKCTQMNGAITSMRLEDIEIRYASYTGFKVPSSAIHIDENGKKCVYALVANQVSLREGKIIYSTKDYSVFEYDSENSNSIRFYDQIITKGKDLHDGKVYT